MNRKKIRLTTPEMVSGFINVCSKYECDINLYDGRNTLDDKSIMGVFGVAQGKVIEGQAISSDESVISSFIEDMKKFEV